MKIWTWTEYARQNNSIQFEHTHLNVFQMEHMHHTLLYLCRDSQKDYKFRKRKKIRKNNFHNCEMNEMCQYTFELSVFQWVSQERIFLYVFQNFLRSENNTCFCSHKILKIINRFWISIWEAKMELILLYQKNFARKLY